MVLKCVLKYLNTDNALSNHVCFVDSTSIQNTSRFQENMLHICNCSLFIQDETSFMSITDVQKTNMTHSSFIGHWTSLINLHLCKNLSLESPYSIPHICHGRHGRRPCKFFLAGVNFFRFNAKNWQFTVYFAVITQKIGNFLCILS